MHTNSTTHVFFKLYKIFMMKNIYKICHSKGFILLNQYFFIMELSNRLSAM